MKGASHLSKACGTSAVVENQASAHTLTKPCFVMMSQLEDSEILKYGLTIERDRCPTPETDISVSSDDDDVMDLQPPMKLSKLFLKYLPRKERRSMRELEDEGETSEGVIDWKTNFEQEVAWHGPLPFEKYADEAEKKERGREIVSVRNSKMASKPHTKELEVINDPKKKINTLDVQNDKPFSKHSSRFLQVVDAKQVCVSLADANKLDLLVSARNNKYKEKNSKPNLSEPDADNTLISDLPKTVPVQISKPKLAAENPEPVQKEMVFVKLSPKRLKKSKKSAEIVDLVSSDSSDSEILENSISVEEEKKVLPRPEAELEAKAFSPSNFGDKPETVTPSSIKIKSALEDIRAKILELEAGRQVSSLPSNSKVELISTGIQVSPSIEIDSNTHFKHSHASTLQKELKSLGIQQENPSIVVTNTSNACGSSDHVTDGFGDNEKCKFCSSKAHLKTDCPFIHEKSDIPSTTNDMKAKTESNIKPTTAQASRSQSLSDVVKKVNLKHPKRKAPIVLSPLRQKKTSKSHSVEIETQLAGLTGISSSLPDTKMNIKEKDTNLKSKELDDLDVDSDPLYQKLMAHQLHENSGKEEQLKQKSPPMSTSSSDLSKDQSVTHLALPNPVQTSCDAKSTPNGAAFQAATIIAKKDGASAACPSTAKGSIQKLKKIPKKKRLDTTDHVPVVQSPLSAIMDKKKDEYSKALLPGDGKVLQANKNWGSNCEKRKPEKRKRSHDDVAARPKKRVRFANDDQLVQIREFTEHAPPNSVVMEPAPLDLLLPMEMTAENSGATVGSGQMIIPPVVQKNQNNLKTFTDEIQIEMLKWNPNWLSEYCRDMRKLPPLLTDFNELLTNLASNSPSSFSSYENYVNMFKPIVLCDLWDAISQDYKQRYIECKESAEPVSFYLERQRDTCNFSIAKVGAIISRNERNSDLTFENQLCQLTGVVNQDEGGKSVKVFGLIKKVSVKRVDNASIVPDYLKDEFTTLQINGKAIDLFVFSLEVYLRRRCKLVNNVQILLQPVSNVSPMFRIVQALVDLSSSPLLPGILHPEDSENFSILQGYLGDMLLSDTGSLNDSQLDVIKSFARDVCDNPNEPKIAMVHGPPGTGKSTTIVGIIEEIKRRRKTSIDHEGGVILILAASNGAVDQLCRKILEMNKRHSEPDNKFLNFIRFGNLEQISLDIAYYSLDKLAKMNAQQWRDELHLKASLHRSRQELLKFHSKKGARLTGFEQKRMDLERSIGHMETRLRRNQVGGSASQAEIQEQRVNLLKRADIVATTLNSSGSASLDFLKQIPITCAIIDEACQSTELESLIPLRFQVKKLMLVGDPYQLPPTVISKWTSGLLLAQSLYGRLRSAHISVNCRNIIEKLLDVQYRMAPEISRFPSSHIYENRLKNSEMVKSNAAYRLNPYLVYNLDYGVGEKNLAGSYHNVPEVEFVFGLCDKILSTTGLSPSQIGIITPYKAQVNQFTEHFRTQSGSYNEIEVNTVDGFQGREKKVVIISCVRSGIKSRIGFLADRRRLNVAITRAQLGLYIVANLYTLRKHSDDWGALINDAHRRNVVFTLKSPFDVNNALKRLQPFR